MGIQPDQADGLLSRPKVVCDAGRRPCGYGMISAEHDRYRTMIKRLLHAIRGQFRAMGDLFEETSTLITQVLRLRNGDRDISSIRDTVSQSFELGL
jgi:hypothetical protein